MVNHGSDRSILQIRRPHDEPKLASRWRMPKCARTQALIVFANKIWQERNPGALSCGLGLAEMTVGPEADPGAWKVPRQPYRFRNIGTHFIESDELRCVTLFDPMAPFGRCIEPERNGRQALCYDVAVLRPSEP